MYCKRRYVLLGVLAVAAVVAADKPDKRESDRRKSLIEAPLERRLVAGKPPAKFDVGKRRMEVSIERLVSAALPANPIAASGEFQNPRVAPGQVHWHKDFAAACVASRESGKPVLLFQMMGNLDDRFC